VALIRRTNATTADLLPADGASRSLVAAASQIQLDAGPSQALRIRDEEWQKEAWRHYDICGEFRFVANRHAGALSRCRMFVAQIDQLGRPGKEASDPKVQVLAESIFGGPAAKAEGLRTVGIQNYVSGECFVVAEGSKRLDGDKWYVASASELRRRGGVIEVKRPMTIGGGWRQLTKGTDLLMRVWTPHPRLFDVADSPARAVLPNLREIERLTQLCFSQIDSRLISAGLLLLPQGLDFPHAADKPGGVQGLMDQILEAARAQLSGAGSAAGLVPIAVEVPTDASRSIAQSFAHVKFDTPLTAELQQKLDQAIRRLALGLDIAPEDLLGQGEANHWSSWQIEESSIKMFIEPVLSRVCDAFTEAYLRPALKALGIDPEKYTLWYDTSPLTVRPNRMEDAMLLWDRGVIGDDALIAAGAFDGGDKPNAKAQLRWIAWQVVKANPAMVAAPAIAGLLGFTPDQIAAGLSVPAGGPPMLPSPMDAGPPGNALPPPSGGAAGAIPDQPSGKASPAQRGQEFSAMLPAAEQVVYRALELAGNRLLDRAARGRYTDVEKFNLHTRVRPADREHAVRLMVGAWDHLDPLARHFSVRTDELEKLLSRYCEELLIHGHPHAPELLHEVLVRGLGR
jgi:hypothetical protein